MKKWLQSLTVQMYRNFFILFLTGFLCGVLTANLGAKGSYRLEGIELLQTGGKRSPDFDARIYFWYLLQKRFRGLVLFLPLGVTGLGLPGVLGACARYGFLAGILTAVALLQLGLGGIGWLTAAVLPQAFFYLPGILLFFKRVYQMSERIWNHQPKAQRDYGSYFLACAGCWLLILWGVLLEAYVNPPLLERLWEYLAKK